MKKKLVLLISSVSVLLIATLLFILNYFGVLEIGADTVGDTKTYTVSGRSFDPLANSPMSGQVINVASDTTQNIQVYTDANGNYTAKIQASTEGFIIVTQGDGGREGDTCSIVTDSNNTNQTCNFELGKPPFNEEESVRDFEEINALSGLTPPPPNLNNFDPIIIDGVNYKPFVTLKDPKYKPNLNSIKIDIAFDAKWLQTLKNATGVTDNFPIIIVSEISWHKGIGSPPDAYMDDNSKSSKMVVDIDFLNPAIISHEFGHHVDWARGFDTRNGIHQESTSNMYFTTAYVNILKNHAIYGHAAKNSSEMFAEFFASMMEPRGNDPTQLDLSSSTGQGYFRDVIKNYLLMAKKDFYYYNMGCHYIETDEGIKTSKCVDGSVINSNLDSPEKRTEEQNSLMYVYKHVSKVSQQIEFFPGEVHLGLSEIGMKPEIPEGKYMQEGVVTVIFSDHKGTPLSKSKVGISTQFDTISETSALYGAGAVLLYVPINNHNFAAYNIPSDYPVPFVGQTVNVKSGSNYMPIQYQKYAVQYKVYPSAYPAGGTLASSTTSLYGEFQANNGQKVTGLTKGSIPRYPDDGTVDGMYGIDSKFTATLPPSEAGKARYYYIEYVIGGGDDFLFPVKETLYGPSAFPKRFLNTKTQFEFDPRPGTGEGIHIIQGVFSKFYKYLPTSFPIFQPLN